MGKDPILGSPKQHQPGWGLGEYSEQVLSGRHLPEKRLICNDSEKAGRFQNLSGVIGRIQKGKLRALAVTTKERVPLLPNVRTFAQLGHPKMELIVGWSALYGPKKLPEEVIDKWRAVLQSVAKDQPWLKTTQSLGSIPMIMNPSDTEEFVKNQYETYKNVTERLGLTIQ